MNHTVYTAACLLLFLTSAIPTHAQSGAVRVFLDGRTLIVGYQMHSGDGNVSLAVLPSALPRPTAITIEMLARQEEAEQRFHLPSDQEFASNVYVYDAARVVPSDMKQPFIIDMKPSLITPWSSLYFFDRASQHWKQLATRPVSNEVLRARVPLPFAPIAVLQKKKHVGALSVSALLAPTHSILVVDGAGMPLVSKNPRIQSAPASITKLMTALVFLEHNPGWKKNITLQQSDDTKPARIPFAPKETVTAYDLFMGMLVGSNNNAAKALARSTGMSEAAFVAAMNAKAAHLKMYHTVFTDTSGLDAHNASTVEDVLRLSRSAFKQKDISAALAASAYTIKGLSSKRTYGVRTTNALLVSAPHIKGKTGYIDESGYNFVGSVQTRRGTVSVALFGAPTSAARFDIVKQILTLVR